MIQDILQKLSQEPDSIVTLLEMYECSKIKINSREIRFARSHDPGSGLNISIRLENNEACIVKDFAHNETNNIISWICKEKNEDFKTVLLSIKHILGLSDDWRPQQRKSLFGGIYDGIIHKTDPPIKIYDESILNEYLRVGNTRFLNDHISLEVQKEFGIGYDVETNRITIPIRNSNGDLIGVKARRNYHSDDEADPKYLYLYPCRMSSTLYGYSDNYKYLYGNTIIIGEAEKFVLQAASYGYRNTVSLGSNSLSEIQAKLILSLQPNAIFWALDEDLPFENTLKNAELIDKISSMIEVPQYWWNYTNDLDIPEGCKSSPTDFGKEKFEEIINTEMEELDLGDEL